MILLWIEPSVVLPAVNPVFRVRLLNCEIE